MAANLADAVGDDGTVIVRKADEDRVIVSVRDGADVLYHRTMLVQGVGR